MSNEEKLKIVDEFIFKYRDKFPSVNGDKNYYIERIRLGIYLENNNELIDEILHATKLLDVKKDPYIAFADFIETKYGLNQNILEVGCGLYPALSEVISERQKSGSVTAYDPLLILEKHENIDLKKEKFEYNTKLKKYDLIVAIKPCEATSLVIYKASDANKNFMIYPCDCGWLGGYDEFDVLSKDEWHDFIYKSCLSYFKSVAINFLDIKAYQNPIYSYKRKY